MDMENRTLQTVRILTNQVEKKLQLVAGDIIEIVATDPVDYLIMSALPNDYTPSENSVIAALNDIGVSVGALAQEKLYDFRPDYPVWISKELSGTGFKKLVVYEAPTALTETPVATVYSLITYVFSAIAKIEASADSIKLALSLLSTRSGGADELDMIEELFYSATDWLSRTAPFETITITLYKTTHTEAELTDKFNAVKNYNDTVTALDFEGYATYAEQANEHVDGMVLPTYLSKLQAFGISMYTTNFYSTINSLLRANDPSSVGFKKLRPLLILIDSGLYNLPVYVNPVYRGESDMSQDRIDENSPGNQVINLAYTSTAYATGEWYLSSEFRFVFQSKGGCVVEDYSIYPEEQEVLFYRIFQYLVDNLTITDIYVFEASEIEPELRR